MKVILGLDPGLQRTGFGCISSNGQKHQLIEAGTIITESKDLIGQRLEEIYNHLKQLIEKLKPEVVSLEQLFFFRNVTSAIKVAQAQGVMRLICQKSNLEVFEYTPLEMKLALTGYGRANKKQIELIVSKILKIRLKDLGSKDDCADALGLALTHASKMGGF